MQITASIWDKASPINGKDAGFLSAHFKKSNNNDDRVLIAYDGVISRIEYVDDGLFTVSEKAHMNELISQGKTREEAIAEVWGEKARKEYDEGERKAAYEAERAAADSGRIQQLEADVLYISIMSGVDL